MPEFVPFPNPLTNSGEYGHAAVQRDNGVHKLREKYSLPNPGTSKQSGLAASDEGKEQIHHLDAGFKNSTHGFRFVERSRLGQNVAKLTGRERRFPVQGFPKYVQDPTEAIRSHGNVDGRSRIEHWHATTQSACSMQGDGAYVALVEMLIDLKGVCLMVHHCAQCLVHRRKSITRDVDHRTAHFGDDSNRVMIVVNSSFWLQSHLALTSCENQSLLLIRSLPVLSLKLPHAEVKL
jgi:hypothetical protein